MKLDLHGLPIHTAWNTFNNKMQDVYYQKYKYIIVVTGQGAIMKEFPTWVSNHPHTKSCSVTPHNPGSFKVIIQK